MKERPPFASGDLFQSLSPAGPNVFIPRFFWEFPMCHLKERGIFNDRLNLSLDDPPPANHIKKSRKIPAHGQPKRLRLIAGDIMGLEPAANRLVTQPM